jgi:hypothetical protein
LRVAACLSVCVCLRASVRASAPPWNEVAGTGLGRREDRCARGASEYWSAVIWEVVSQADTWEWPREVVCFVVTSVVGGPARVRSFSLRVDGANGRTGASGGWGWLVGRAVVFGSP